MAYLEHEGSIQLKPIAWSKWEKAGEGCIGIKFEFVNKDGLKVDGAFGWTKRDGSENENIQIFSDAFEQQKSVLCEVQKGREKRDGGHFYQVKWAVTGSSESSTSVAELKSFMKSRPTEPDGAIDEEIPPF